MSPWQPLLRGCPVTPVTSILTLYPSCNSQSYTAHSHWYPCLLETVFLALRQKGLFKGGPPNLLDLWPWTSYFLICISVLL